MKVGTVSGRLEEEQYGYKPRSRIYAGKNWGWQTEESYQKTIELRRGAAFFNWTNSIGQKLSELAAPVLQPIAEAVAPVVEFADGAIRSAPVVGPIYEGSEALTEKLQETAAQHGYDRRTGDVAAAVIEEVAMAGVGKAAKGLKTVVQNLPPPPRLAVASGSASISFQPPTPPTPKGGQVFQAASTLPRPSNWQTRARRLYEQQNHRELADLFRRGPGGKLSKKNTFITADELSLNKGGVLDQMLERADRMEGLRTKWDEAGNPITGDRQRELYDAASLNPNHQDIEMYSSDAARKYITKFTNVLSKDQWHHIFGNKEAGEFILSIANSDPLVAANLFKKMEALGLNSSGVSKNIAILKKAKHTSWHNFIKDMGFEPKAPGKPLSVKGSTAPGDFADISQELGRAIASGKGDINDAFELLELYAKYNEWMKTQITSTKFGGLIINELPEGVGKSVQIGGYRKRPPKSTYDPLPEL